MVWEKNDGRQTTADAVDRLARTEDGSALHGDAQVSRASSANARRSLPRECGRVRVVAVPPVRRCACAKPLLGNPRGGLASLIGPASARSPGGCECGMSIDRPRKDVALARGWRRDPRPRGAWARTRRRPPQGPYGRQRTEERRTASWRMRRDEILWIVHTSAGLINDRRDRSAATHVSAVLLCVCIAYCLVSVTLPVNVTVQSVPVKSASM
jgi:hypothetical protein